MLKNYKLSTILTIIGTSILLLVGAFGLSMLFDGEGSLFNSIYGETMESIKSFFSLLNFDEQAYLTFLDTYYIATLITNTFNVLLVIPAFILAIFNLKESNLDYVSYRKRTKLHVWYLITLIVAFDSSFDIALYVSDVNSVTNNNTIVVATAFGYVGALVLFLSLINCLRSFKALRKINKMKDNSNTVVEPTNDEVINEEIVEEPINDSETIIDSNKEIEKETEKQPEKPKVDMAEIYELLAKLEHQHNNKEISDEDYKRMKETILERVK